MKKLVSALFLLELLFAQYYLSSALNPQQEAGTKLEQIEWHVADKDLKEEVYGILDSKCNVCHKKQNPFKVFSLKNMDKYAEKIYQQVFIKGRMPKGNKIKLTGQEYQKLDSWLKTKISQ